MLHRLLNSTRREWPALVERKEIYGWIEDAKSTAKRDTVPEVPIDQLRDFGAMGSVD